MYLGASGITYLNLRGKQNISPLKNPPGFVVSLVDAKTASSGETGIERGKND